MGKGGEAVSMKITRCEKDVPDNATTIYTGADTGEYNLYKVEGPGQRPVQCTPYTGKGPCIV